jgi:hypothetical protein
MYLYDISRLLNEYCLSNEYRLSMGRKNLFICVGTIEININKNTFFSRLVWIFNVVLATSYLFTVFYFCYFHLRRGQVLNKCRM